MHLTQWHDAFGDLLAAYPERLASKITGTARFSVNDRLNVYRNNYQQGLIHHLRLSFERCNAHVGDEYFTQLAMSYIREYPPITHSLQAYGDKFPQHLKALLTTRPELETMAYLPDLAKTDWLCDQVYVRPQRKQWPQQAFEQLHPTQQAQLRLLISPDCLLFTSHWPLSQLWELHRAQRSQLSMNYLEQAEYLLIHRSQYRIQLEKLPAHIYFLLTAVEDGTPLHQLAAQYPEGISHLPDLIRKGWIHDFEVDPSHA